MCAGTIFCATGAKPTMENIENRAQFLYLMPKFHCRFIASLLTHFTTISHQNSKYLHQNVQTFRPRRELVSVFRPVKNVPLLEI